MAGLDIDVHRYTPDRGIISRGKSGLWLFEIRSGDISTPVTYNLSPARGIIRASDSVLLRMCN